MPAITTADLKRDGTLDLVEVKIVSTEQRLIEGHAAATGSLDRNRDILEPGAFAETVKAGTDSVAVLISHDFESLPVGELTEMVEDAKGLRVQARVFATARGDELLEVARDMHARGKALGMSIGFRVIDAEFKQRKLGEETILVRHVKQVQVREISFLPIQMAANTEAQTLGVKAADGDEEQMMIALPPGLTEEQAAEALAAVLPPAADDTANDGGDDDDEDEEGHTTEPETLTADAADLMLADVALASAASMLED